MPKEFLYVGEVPVHGDLGFNDKDFSNCGFGRLHIETMENDSGEWRVGVVATGKLGGLTGGMLSIDDVRVAMSKEDVMQCAINAMEEHLTNKRTGWGRYHTIICSIEANMALKCILFTQCYRLLSSMSHIRMCIYTPYTVYVHIYTVHYSAWKNHPSAFHLALGT